MALQTDLSARGSDEARLVRVVMIDVDNRLNLLRNELREGDAHVSRLVASETKSRQVITLDIDLRNRNPALRLQRGPEVRHRVQRSRRMR